MSVKFWSMEVENIHSPMEILNISSSVKKVNLAGIPETVQMLQCIITFLLNFVVFLLILSQEKLRGKVAHQLFLNLQMSHMLLCTVIIISESVMWTWGQFYILVDIGNAIVMEIFISLIIYSADRLFAINLPFTHKFLKLKHVAVAVMISWLLPVAFALLSLNLPVIQQYMDVILTVMIGAAATVLTITNVVVYFMATKHDRFVRENTDRWSTYGKYYTGKQMLKASSVCLCVVSSFVLCWLPYLVHSVLSLLSVYEPGSKKAFTIVAKQLALVDSLLDPVLFVLLAPDARLVIFKLLSVRRSSTEDCTTLRLAHDS